MLAKWLHIVEKRYGDETTYKKAAAFLDGHGGLEDWGCGTCYARRYFHHSRYTGVDGSGPFADIIADLRFYTSRSDCILIRHVLEHNSEWKAILSNAVASFQNRMVLATFTPFGPTTKNIRINRNGICDISFRKAELTELLLDYLVDEESLTTKTEYGSEHLFYLKRP